MIPAPAVPSGLTALDQWVLWRYEDRQGKKTKVPCMTDGRRASTTDPSTWLSYEAARTAFERDPEAFDGVGFVFSANDPFAGVDLDNCLDESGEPKAWAIPLLHKFEDTYTEISPSGKGLKLFVRAKLPDKGKRKEYADGAIEVYDCGRYFAVTGNALNGCPNHIEEHQRDIEDFYKLASNAASNGSGNGSAPAGDRIRQGQRHNTLVSLAGTMRKRGMGVEAIFAALWAHNTAHCEPPYDAGHVRKIASDAGQWERGDPGKDLWQFPFTDIGNAERLALLHGGEIRYCHAWEKWLVWDRRRWVIDGTAEIVRRAKDTIRRMHRTALDIGDEKIRHAAQDFSRTTEKHARITAMISLAGAELGIPVLPEELDTDPWLLNVANGTIDLRTGELRPHAPRDLITKLCPVDYDPRARADVWLGFQSQVMNGNQDLIAFKQRAIGYALTGTALEKRSLYMYVGQKNNGKTTELELLRDMLGDYSGQVRIEVLMEQKNQNGAAPSPDIADLRGLRFVVSSEPKQGNRLSESLIKYLTGMGTIKARHLHRENFEFRQTWKFFMDCNAKPVISGSDSAIWTRIGVVPFDIVIPDENIDPSMPARLRAELPGILAWAVRGCLGWQRSGGLGIPDKVRDATADYCREMDVIGRFIEDCCVVLPNASARGKQLYQAYVKWASDVGETPGRGGENSSLSMITFGDQITAKGFSKAHDNKGVRYDGIGLRAVGKETSSDDQ